MWISASTEDWSACRLAQVAALPEAEGADEVVVVELDDEQAASATATSTGATT
jgi:hypothetical protein